MSFSVYIIDKDRLIVPINSVLNDSKITCGKIYTLILVGSSSNIPAIKSLIETEFKIKMFSPVNKNEAIATGAAIYGTYLLKKTDPQYKSLKICEYSELKITGVTPMDISMRIKGDKLDKLIPRNSKLLAESEWKRYIKNSTGDGKFIASLMIYEGNSSIPNQCF